VVFSEYINKIERHDVGEIFLKVAVNKITITSYWADTMLLWDIIVFSISDNVVAYTEGNLNKYINPVETSQPSILQDVRSPMNMTILTVQIKKIYTSKKFAQQHQMHNWKRNKNVDIKFSEYDVFLR
jgi:hypothetical protein